MRFLAFLAVLLAAGMATAADNVGAALADARVQGVSVQPYLRYLDLTAVQEKGRKDLRAALASHVNGASREPDIVPPAAVSETLLRINLKDYRWSPALWEKLLEVPEPYYHLSVEVEEDVFAVTEYGNWFDTYGRTCTKGTPGAVWRTTETRREKTGTRKVKRANASAFWLDPREISELIVLTQTQIPIVRGDWFFAQTSIQKDRVVGYCMISWGSERKAKTSGTS